MGRQLLGEQVSLARHLSKLFLQVSFSARINDPSIAFRADNSDSSRLVSAGK
jgi:hypothetical protein